jgi:uncharacterized metal-binding protein
MSCECGCGGSVKLIFPCSGGSDVGALTDQAARRLTTDGIGKMYCVPPRFWLSTAASWIAPAGLSGRRDSTASSTLG